MNELVKNNSTEYKEILCPKCLESCFFQLDNYKITLYKCKNNHVTNNIFLKDFKETQKFDSSKIICDKCKGKDINCINNTKKYKCYSCGLILCKKCKSLHNNNHKLINYDKKNYKCIIHNEIYNSYCITCNNNLCMLCENIHKNHQIIYYKNIMPNIANLKDEMGEFKNTFNIFNNEIQSIIKILENTINNLNIYYEISMDLINNFIIKNRNYQILTNLNNIKYTNKFVLNNIKEIIKEKNIYFKFNNIINLYDKMTKESKEF